jgi:hypothetical protein
LSRDTKTRPSSPRDRFLFFVYILFSIN